MYDHLPKKEKTFNIDLKGDDTLAEYKGDFTVRCVLGMAQRHSLELEKTRLMADYANPSQGLRSISIALANVRARIVESPKWWRDLNNGGDILDENIVFDLYAECLKAEDEWRDKVKKLSEDVEEPKEEDQGN